MQTIYFDHAATSFPKAPGVAEAVAACLGACIVNLNRSGGSHAEETALQVLETRELLCRAFHFSGKPTLAVFTPGNTFGLNQLLFGYLSPGDHVIVSSLEHNAVMRPLQALAASGVEFSRIPADGCGRTDPNEVLPLLRHNTKLVLVSHASNVCGTLFPLKELAALLSARGIPLAVDAAQSAGHVPIDFDALGLAALSLPAHKGMRGPQGVGALLLTASFAKSLRPLVSGGTGSASDSEQQPVYLPDKFESGTLNLPGILGLRAALTHFIKQDPLCLQQRESALTRRLLEGLSSADVRIVGPHDASAQVGVVSVDFSRMDNAEAAYRLEQEYGILTRCGLHCAPDAHKTLSTFPKGTVRFSLGAETTEQEINRAVSAVRHIAAGARP